MNKVIKLSQSCVGEEEIAAVTRVINNKYLGMGAEVIAFEQELKDFIGDDLSEVICVNSGTAALHLALQALGVGIGDEVLVPTITYVACFQAISATGAKPVACDVNFHDVSIDLKDAESRVTKATKAMLVVHYAGMHSGIDDVYRFAKKFNLRVVEDAAHSFGGVRNGEKIGANGDVVCFSFDGIKNITSGEGGAIVTKDSSVACRARDYRLLGVKHDTAKRASGKRTWDLEVKEQGWRYHMSNLNAAIGREQLKKINKFKEIRQGLVALYCNLLSEIKDIIIFDICSTDIIPHIFPIRILNNKRDKVQNLLLDNNIEVGVHYKPNHLLDKYNTKYSLVASEELYGQLLTLPLHVNMLEKDTHTICERIKHVFK